MREKTQWYPADVKPVRGGEYEARGRRTQVLISVHWRKLSDTDHFDWYVFRGILGPFALWENVSHKVTSWRGLAAPVERGGD